MNSPPPPKNPLNGAILKLLQQHEGGLSEHQIHRHLESELTLLVESTEPNLRLFQRHFWVKNGLYQLQQEQLQQGRYLEISALQIRLLPLTSSGRHHLAEPDRITMRDYYLDWQQLQLTSSSDVERLLSQFWQRFRSHGQQGGAYQALGLAADASWDAIQQRYRQLAAQHHPDRGGEQQRFVAIRQAYEALKRQR